MMRGVNASVQRSISSGVISSLSWISRSAMRSPSLSDGVRSADPKLSASCSSPSPGAPLRMTPAQRDGSAAANSIATKAPREFPHRIGDASGSVSTSNEMLCSSAGMSSAVSCAAKGSAVTTVPYP